MMMIELSSFKGWAVCTHKPCDVCEEHAAEAWERMTFGGVVAREDDLVPNNTLTNVGGQWVSHPIQRSFDAGYFARRGDV